MITFTAVDFFQVLDLENYDLDIFNMASTEGLDMESIGGFFKFFLPLFRTMFHIRTGTRMWLHKK
jgi:hypothetical protein